MKEKGGVRTSVAILIIMLIVISIVAVPLIFLQFRVLDLHETEEVPQISGIRSLDLHLVANMGRVNVSFVKQEGSLVTLNATVEGRAGFFGDTNPLSVAFKYSMVGDALNVNSTIRTYGPWPYYSISQVHYEVIIDPSLESRLNITTTTGGILVSTRSGVTLNDVDLDATTEGAVLDLVGGTVLAGDVKVKTATGGSQIQWSNVTVTGDVSVDLKESSGVIKMFVNQSLAMGGNVIVKAANTAGGVRVDLQLVGGVGAVVMSNSPLGGVKVNDRGGFSGDGGRFSSQGYPGQSNFDFTLNSTVGGILVNGQWTP